MFISICKESMREEISLYYSQRTLFFLYKPRLVRDKKYFFKKKWAYKGQIGKVDFSFSLGAKKWSRSS
jgi:hypothetical protein